MSHDKELKVLNKRTLWFVIISQAVMMMCSLYSSIRHTGPSSAAIITYVFLILYVVYALYYKDNLLKKLIVFGIVAGFVELWADHYSVATIHALVYPPGETFIVSSPLYMPFAWANVFVQLGYYSLWLFRWKGLVVASVLMGIMGGLYIPFYENFAREAGWWEYHNVSMFLNAPFYIIICEALISLTLPLCLYFVVIRKYSWAIALGALEGIWILVSAIIAYAIAP